MATLIENRQKKIKLDLPRLRRSLKKIVRYLECGDKEISLLLTDNETIREMNRRYLGRDYPTNVISFSLSEGKFGNINPSLLGDVIISVERAQTDAGKARMDFTDELDFLVIHGVLHLLGYNHEGDTSSDETRVMEKRERAVFFMLKGSWPYRRPCAGRDSL
jgi:probable rRNA maturation factor